MSSFVYFLQAVIGGPIKIGSSVNVEARVVAMQTGCPFELRVLATMPGGLLEERAMHSRFCALRGAGEWFRPGPELIEVIRAIAPLVCGMQRSTKRHRDNHAKQPGYLLVDRFRKQRGCCGSRWLRGAFVDLI